MRVKDSSITVKPGKIAVMLGIRSLVSKLLILSDISFELRAIYGVQTNLKRTRSRQPNENIKSR
jgi:hypothetical protein